MAKLLYIASAGHSGSTLLDILAGTIPQVTSTGECVYLPWQLYRRGRSDPKAAKQDICSCLKSFRECQTWRRIIESLSDRLGFDIFEDPLRFRIALLRSPIYHGGKTSLERIFHGLYSYCVQFPHIDLSARLWGIPARRAVHNNWLLFDTIGDVCGTEYVVDSSKDIIRMHMLRCVRPTAVKLLVLVRDVRGVAASSLKRGKDPMVSAKTWLRTYTRIFNVIKKIRNLPIMLISYEDLCADPPQLRRKIANFLDLPDPGEDLSINTHQHHLVAGNPMRYRGKIKIKMDIIWPHLLDKHLSKKIQNIGTKIEHYWDELEQLGSQVKGLDD